jgi:hypothetical protein
MPAWRSIVRPRWSPAGAVTAAGADRRGRGASLSAGRALPLQLTTWEFWVPANCLPRPPRGIAAAQDQLVRASPWVESGLCLLRASPASHATGGTGWREQRHREPFTQADTQTASRKRLSVQDSGRTREAALLTRLGQKRWKTCLGSAT